VKWIDTGPTTDLGDGQTISIPVGRRMIAVARSGEAYLPLKMSALTTAPNSRAAPSRERKSFARVTAPAFACERGKR